MRGRIGADGRRGRGPPMSEPPVRARLEMWLSELPRAVVAVSGGVDSMTLAVVAGRLLGDRAEMAHAVSPAVPAEATRRVRRFASEEGWRLRLFDAGELSDPRYVSNPANRCYFCKSNLYRAIGAHTAAPVLSGTNRDDLGDVRPGLEAAERHGVRHPWVEVDAPKSAVRAVARELGLADLAELPASPCLASRIETGLPVRPSTLALVERVETALRSELAPSVLRCRVVSSGLRIELDRATLSRLGPSRRRSLRERIRPWARRAGVDGPVRFDTYRRGSAFLWTSSGSPERG